jgi:hypothetical protein
MSRVSLSGEAEALLQQTPLTERDLLDMGLEAARHSFLAEPARRQAAEAFKAWR